MNNNILAVGSIAFDSIKTIKGSCNNIIGGSSTYFSIAASKYANVHIVGIVGNDFPQSGWELYSNNNIDIAGNHWHRFLDCDIADLMISAESLYLNQFTPLYPFITSENALLHYDFNQSGNELIDLSENGNIGVIHGEDGMRFELNSKGSIC